MPQTVRLLRSTVAAEVPGPGTREPGEPWVNFADQQFGYIDPAQTAQGLIMVRNWSASANYDGGDFVWYMGELYRALANVISGAFNPTQWSRVARLADLEDGYLPLTGGTLTGPLTGTGAAFDSGVRAQSLLAFDPTGVGGVVIDGPAGAAHAFQGRTNGSIRWEMELGDGAPEVGNSGANFALARYTTAGVIIDNPLTIARATGQATFSTVFTTPGYTSRPGTGGAAGGNNWNIEWRAAGAPADLGAHLWIDGTDVGVFLPASDYRIKKDVAPLAPMWDRVKALNPIRYTIADYTPPPPPVPEQGVGGGSITQPIAPAPLFVADDHERWGFIAHELQETLIPTAATGVKDQENCIQSPDVMTVIATLTKALQEAMARIEALTARIDGLGPPLRQRR